MVMESRRRTLVEFERDPRHLRQSPTVPAVVAVNGRIIRRVRLGINLKMRLDGFYQCGLHSWPCERGKPDRRCVLLAHVAVTNVLANGTVTERWQDHVSHNPTHFG